MSNKIKPSAKKITDSNGNEVWHISYTDENGQVYECQHEIQSIAIRSWYNMFSISLGIKTGGG